MSTMTQMPRPMLSASRRACQLTRTPSCLWLGALYQQRRTAKSSVGSTPGVNAPGWPRNIRPTTYRDSTEERGWKGEIDDIPNMVKTWYWKRSDQSLPLNERDLELIAQFAQEYIRAMPGPLAVGTASFSISELKGLYARQRERGVSVKQMRVCWYMLSSLNGGVFKRYSHMLASHLSVVEKDVNSTVVRLEVALRQMKRHGYKKAMQSRQVLQVRQSLRDLIEQSGDDMFELRVLEGRLLLADGKEDDAIAIFQQTMPAAMASSAQKLHSKVVDPWYQPGVPRSDAHGLLTPWDDLIDVYYRKRQTAGPAQQAALNEQISRVIDAGVTADSALSHWYAAERANSEYCLKEMEGYRDESAGLTREPRNRNEIGKPSTWLYHMTKAAASLLPDACVELGKFYWATRWPFLDDEPAANTKPTPLDRCPEAPSFDERLRRVRESLGLSSTPAGPQDMFNAVSSPPSLHARLSLAKSWLECADNVYYAPALRTLIEMHSTRQVASDIATPRNALRLAASRYTCSSKAGLLDLIFDGRYDQRPPPEMVANPFYNERKTQEYLARAFSAFEALRLFREHQRRKGQDSSLEQFFRDKLSDRLDRSSVARWIAFRDVFNLWEDDHDVCQEMQSYIRNICDERRWDIHNERNMLVYSYKR